ncbi:hypothetical protein DN508_35055 [Burkholderia multivorans]|nr:hypothetical protein DN508_35055 [Burkholderia multivorans]
MMSDREQFRLDARVWTIAVIGMVIGGVVGLLIWGPLQMIPFAMIGFALGLAIAWMLDRSSPHLGEIPHHPEGEALTFLRS